MEWYFYILTILAGILSGFINTLAGSGSLITLPLLIFLGLPANVANGTNRVAILLQSLVGMRGFQSHGFLDPKSSVRFAVPAMIGAVLGAQIAVDLNEELMRRVIGAIMVLMLVIMLLNPKRWVEGGKERHRIAFLEPVVYFLTGIYGGFIQAGVGIFLISALVLISGMDILRANAIKVFVTLLLTLPALAVFMFNGQVVWTVGAILALGSMAGAYFGVKFASKKGAAVWVHRLLVAIVLVSSMKLLGIFSVILLWVNSVF
ncbi:sulfite exporter TauE/SafE family protein [Geoglobus acetivorans]|nr:sulfite exporter TauE/SafE family protein [Geoglobus acetivorans]